MANRGSRRQIYLHISLQTVNSNALQLYASFKKAVPGGPERGSEGNENCKNNNFPGQMAINPRHFTLLQPHFQKKEACSVLMSEKKAP